MIEFFFGKFLWQPKLMECKNSWRYLQDPIIQRKGGQRGIEYDDLRSQIPEIVEIKLYKWFLQADPLCLRSKSTPRNPPFRLLFDFRCIMMNPWFHCCYETAQKLTRVASRSMQNTTSISFIHLNSFSVIGAWATTTNFSKLIFSHWNWWHRVVTVFV